MTATALDSRARIGLGFPRLVRSEWIKFRSVRSTLWCFAILVVLTVGMAALLGALVDPEPGKVLQDAANRQVVNIATLSVGFTVLVVAVLGVLIITGEYTTGQIRSTFTADPGRLGALGAKAVVLAVATFLVSAVSTWIGVAIAVPLQAAKGVEADLADPSVFLPILGASVDVTMIALLAFAVGLLVRSSAGGIAITLGLLLVVPIILQLMGNLLGAQWLLDTAAFMPDAAGMRLYTYSVPQVDDASGTIVLSGWAAFGVLAAWVAAVAAFAVTAAKTRDV
ncbi:ABC transporter permease subunit [Curtobacterium sp. MCBA15_012]|uniref:ABC transporter permease subunit n=1 Tax=Curtobacterium sp. MCBA15_012 TaxID=1898738 RepID=UPI0008DE37BA|nr:ABC transporter permease subunit [Curtobacterium sp. MCBA15_012]WIA99531.1 ABC transporter permease subunit [Curtobacterium sp. MCBA15_012]